MSDTSFKTSAGRLREAGAKKILDMRATEPPSTYQQIAAALDVSIGTVFNVCKGRTWGWLQDAQDGAVSLP